METIKELESKAFIEMAENLARVQQVADEQYHRAVKAEKEVQFLRGVIQELESKVYGGTTQ